MGVMARSSSTGTIDLAPSRVPKNPAGYWRISDDRTGEERGVTRQQEDGENLRARLGWGPFYTGADPYIENDTSAFKKRRVRLADGSSAMRVVRPHWDRLLNDLRTGVIDGVIVYDLDRLARQPRDLEDLIDIVEQRKVPVMSVTGSIDLMDSNGRAMARVMVTMALKSSEDTSRRVARAAWADAKAGTTVRGGPRRFGWEPDGEKLRESEAKIVREMTKRVVGGERVSSLVLDLQSRNVATVSGKTWSRTALQTVLRSPRLAGIRAYQGHHHSNDAKPTINEWRLRVLRDENSGEYVRGSWETILPVTEWEALQLALDGNQSTAVANRVGSGQQHNGGGRFSRVHLLSGSVRCGNCGSPMVGKAMHGRRVYGCRPRDLGGCNSISRNMEKVDALIIQLCIRYLEGDGGRTFTSAKPVVNEGLAIDLSALEERRTRMREAYAKGLLPDEDFFATMGLIADQIAVVKKQQGADSKKGEPKAKAIMVEELRNPGVPNSRKRTIIDDMIDYIIVKPSSRGPHFNPDDIVPKWWDGDSVDGTE